jgi:hypothetical protein
LQINMRASIILNGQSIHWVVHRPILNPTDTRSDRWISGFQLDDLGLWF